jgi:hypothetical protein
LSLDPDGVLRCLPIGFWTAAYVDIFMSDARKAFARSRERHGGARVLIDVSDAAVQTAEVMERFGRLEKTLLQPGDMRAFVNRSALKRAQLSRGLNQDDAKVFDTVADARRWLLPSSVTD